MATTLAELRKDLPYYDGVSDEGMFNDLHQTYFSNIDKIELAKKLSYDIPLKTDNTGDFLKGIGEGALRTPSMVTGLADIPAGIGGFDRPADRLTDQIGQATGFTPKKWADETQYSEATTQASKEVDSVWNDPNSTGLDVAKTIVKNPRAITRPLLTSIVPMVAGGVAGRGAAALGVPDMVALAGSEGAVSAGTLMDSIDKESDPVTSAVAATTGGAFTAILGVAGQKAAQALGVTNLEGAIIGIPGSKGTANLPTRVIGGAAVEGLAEEAPQSVNEQMAQNYAENKPIMEGTGRAAIEGGIVGGIMGGGANVMISAKDDVQKAETVDEAIAAMEKHVTQKVAKETIKQPEIIKGSPEAEAAGEDARRQALALVGESDLERNAFQVANTAGVDARTQALALADGFNRERNANNVAIEAGEKARQDALALVDEKSLSNSGINILGNMIGKGEGSYTSINKGTSNGKIIGSGKEPNLVNMTIGDIKSLQAQHVNAQNSGIPGQGVFAVGKYQFIPETFKRAAAKAGLKDTDSFSPMNQEKMFMANLPDKVKAYINGSHNDIDGAIEALSHEWASIPSISKGGASYYGQGNKASHSIDEVRNVLQTIRNGGGVDLLSEAITPTFEEGKTELDQEAKKPEPQGILDKIFKQKPEATHELNDGTPLWMDGEDFKDADGNIWAAEDALPINKGINEQSKPTKNETPQEEATTQDIELKNADIQAKAHEAATSPLNDLAQPTQAQKEAGNYKKGHVNVAGLDITVENPKGSKRTGIDTDGNKWSVDMNNHYGYVKRTVGADGEQVDVFIGENPLSQNVFVVDQTDPKTGKFDEHKVMLGFDNVADAESGYRSNYSKGWNGLGAITAMPIDEFKSKLANGEFDKPIKPNATKTESWIIRDKKTGKVEFETWDKAKAVAINRKKYEAIPALQHLQELNQEGSKARKAAESIPETVIPQAKPKKPVIVKPTDELKQAITKLGGIRFKSEPGKSDGADRAGFTDFKKNRFMFHNGAKAKTFDEMAESLRELGFTDIDGENTLIDKLYDSLNGVPYYTPEGAAKYMQAQEEYRNDGLDQQEAEAAIEIEEAIDDDLYDVDDFDVLATTPMSSKDFEDFLGLANDDTSDIEGETSKTDTEAATESNGGGQEAQAETGNNEPDKTEEVDLLQPQQAPTEKAKNTNSGTQEDVFTEPGQEETLANMQALADLERKKDAKRQGTVSDGGELFQDYADLAGQQDITDLKPDESILKQDIIIKGQGKKNVGELIFKLDARIEALEKFKDCINA